MCVCAYNTLQAYLLTPEGPTFYYLRENFKKIGGRGSGYYNFLQIFIEQRENGFQLKTDLILEPHPRRTRRTEARGTRSFWALDPVELRRQTHATQVLSETPAAESLGVLNNNASDWGQAQIH